LGLESLYIVRFFVCGRDFRPVIGIIIGTVQRGSFGIVVGPFPNKIILNGTGLILAIIGLHSKRAGRRELLKCVGR
jgi:hypothetical protein